MNKKFSFYKIMSTVSTFITFFSLFIIVSYIIIKGLPSFSMELLNPVYTSENVSMLPSIVTTIIVVVLSILIATPIGISTAIYLVEYAKKDSKLVIVIRLAIETLQGIPSIVYGLFGMLLFVIKLDMKYSVLSGVCTLSIMILPLIIRSTEEALKNVNDNIRFASYGLGAGKLRTIFVIVLPTAISGIMAGVILAIGRIVGETACLIYTLGTATNMITGLSSSSRTLALHMYMLSSEGLHVGEAYATAMILLVVVLIINFISNSIANRFKGAMK